MRDVQYDRPRQCLPRQCLPRGELGCRPGVDGSEDVERGEVAVLAGAAGDGVCAWRGVCELWAPCAGGLAGCASLHGIGGSWAEGAGAGAVGCEGSRAASLARVGGDGARGCGCSACGAGEAYCGTRLCVGAWCALRYEDDVLCVCGYDGAGGQPSGFEVCVEVALVECCIWSHDLYLYIDLGVCH